MKNDQKIYSATVTKLPGSKAELKGEITWEYFATFEDQVVTKLAGNLELDGFRKGAVPKDIARKQLPDGMILAEMAELAINSIYSTLLSDHNLDVIGRPEVAITKIARDNALGFTITTAIVPEITLPDYKKIGAGITLEDPKEVTDADVTKVVEDLRQMRAYGHVHGEHDGHQHDEPLPEVDEAFVSSFGPFKTVEEFRTKIKENLMHEAEQATRDARRVNILDAVVKETTFEVPEIVLASEQEKMLAQIEADVARSGASMDDYLKHIQKTKEDLKKEFAPEAEKRARFQLVLNAIARKENILPTEAEVEAEAQKFMAMYPSADLNRTRAYADMMLTNEKVLAMLEGTK